MAKTVAMVQIRDACWMRELAVDPRRCLLYESLAYQLSFWTKIMLPSMTELPSCWKKNILDSFYTPSLDLCPALFSL